MIVIIIIMGVTGSGKTTIGRLLASQLNWRFEDADSFHSTANKDKISRGISLSDADRAPWLAAIRSALANSIKRQENVVLACSALKKSYRDELQIGTEVRFVYLKGTYQVIDERVRLRAGHFAGESILKSQFDTLEEPDNAIVVDVQQPPEDIVRQIRVRLGLAQEASN